MSSDRQYLIYVVDDDPLLADLFTEVLRAGGYEVQTYNSAEAALVALEGAGRKPDLLVTDHQMGGLTGLELIARSKLLCPSLQTVLVSGSVEVESLEKAVVSPTRFMAKPFQPADMMHSVRELLAGVRKD